jgi:DNA modification methylase
MTEREGARMCLLHGDCREVMASLDACSVDAIVTDPPYGIHFMGKTWDGFGTAIGVDHKTTRERSGSMHAGLYDLSLSANRRFQEWCASWGVESLRILKPGGHMVVSGSPRTYHRMASGLEDAGFEIRDSLMWLFGSGFPKSLDVSKALDKSAGAEREETGGYMHGGSRSGGINGADAGQQWHAFTAPATDLARAWEGWGTALKPAYEPIVLARKPLQGTVAGNVERWGTGGLNIDATRIEGGARPWRQPIESDERTHQTLHTKSASPVADTERGRWPANVLLDAEAARLLDAMSGELTTGRVASHSEAGQFFGSGADVDYADVERGGGASRFFYTAKSSRREREFGLDDLEPSRRSDGRDKDIENPRLRTNERRNDHPTVKPVDLMRWLCRLITPPNGVILDPFMGSGSTGMAALDEGFRFIGIDMDEHYIEIARRRISRRHVLEPLPQRETGQGILL